MLYTRWDALKVLRPGASFSINHEENDRIETYEHELPIPTDQELDDKAKELNEAEAMRLLRELRDKLLDECDKVIMKYMTWSRVEDADWAHGDHPATHSNDAFRVVPKPWLTFMQDLRALPQTSTPQLLADGTLDMKSFEMPWVPAGTGTLKLVEMNRLPYNHHAGDPVDVEHKLRQYGKDLHRGMSAPAGHNGNFMLGYIFDTTASCKLPPLLAHYRQLQDAL